MLEDEQGGGLFGGDLWSTKKGTSQNKVAFYKTVVDDEEDNNNIGATRQFQLCIAGNKFIWKPEQEKRGFPVHPPKCGVKSYKNTTVFGWVHATNK
ncbi:hypothetical protein ACA910_002931 [Epithemia clementina (nom. ined.)]